MKKSIFAVILSFVSVSSASAIGPDVFNHIGFGASVGLTGISIEAATPITRFVQMRAGVSIMPGIKFGVHDIDVNYTSPLNTQESTTVDLDGNLKRVQGQVIFNVYPIPMKSLYVAVGAYFGGSTIVDIKGSSPALAGMNEAEVEIGDYTLPVDNEGNVNGGIKVNGFRPYFGLGWGRAVPGKLVNFEVELGVQIHGTPKLYTDSGEIGVSTDFGDDTFQKIMDKVKVYPNLAFRVNFRAY